VQSGYISCCFQLRDGFLEVGFARFFLCPHILVVAVVCVGKDMFLRAEEAEGAWVEVMSELIIDKVRNFLQSLLPTMGLELFDVQFRREGHGWVLRVFIETETGVTLEDCSNVSRELGRYLDVEDFIDHAYHLEVSSPGLERPLRSTDDFRRYRGRRARVKTHDAIDGEKVFEGVIEEVVNDRIHLRLDDDRSIQFSFEKINKARLAI
jgi:ribosome maturation factor RimP